MQSSFYIAKCDGATAITGFRMEQQGKTQVTRPVVTITTEMQKLQAEKELVEKRDAALSKLSKEERELLGLK